VGHVRTMLIADIDICKSVEDYGPEELKAELTPILAQRVCVHIKLGELDKAEEVAKEIDISR
jgi:hypothetical protein